MSSTVRALLATVLVLSTGSILFFGIRQFTERQRTTNEINRLREDLYRARVASDRCRGSLVSSESALRTLGSTIDSMRSVVDSFEALGGGQVPSGSYDEYLEAFDGYNDSVSTWETRSERLRSAEAACRAAIEEHNALSDSIQAVLREAGIEADDSG